MAQLDDTGATREAENTSADSIIMTPWVGVFHIEHGVHYRRVAISRSWQYDMYKSAFNIQRDVTAGEKLEKRLCAVRVPE
jgi:hypothetical protein